MPVLTRTRSSDLMREAGTVASADPPFLVAFNLTRRCNLKCAHCYLDAGERRDGGPGELSTSEVRKILDDIASLSTETMIVMTGGEPLLRSDLEELVAHASDLGFMVVLGTNGVNLTERRIKKLQGAGLAGVGISIDSLNAVHHDVFRGCFGSWERSIAAIKACRNAGLGFQVHFSVTDDNAHEFDDMVAFCREVGALVLNVFFLVCSGRGESVTNISAETYERVLRRITRAAREEQGLLIRAKCAPHFKRMALELDPDWPITSAHGYEAGGCLAGTRYCRVTPEGAVTACPYMEEEVGDIRADGFVKIWNEAPQFNDLRAPKLEGKCGACEYSKVCGGCRARPLARDNNLMGEDFLCDYEPQGGAVIEPLSMIPDEEIQWSSDAAQRLSRIPMFVQRRVRTSVETYVREKGRTTVDVADMEAVAKKRFGSGGPFAAAAKRFREMTRSDV